MAIGWLAGCFWLLHFFSRITIPEEAVGMLQFEPVPPFAVIHAHNITNVFEGRWNDRAKGHNPNSVCRTENHHKTDCLSNPFGETDFD